MRGWDALDVAEIGFFSLRRTGNPVHVFGHALRVESPGDFGLRQQRRDVRRQEQTLPIVSVVTGVNADGVPDHDQAAGDALPDHDHERSAEGVDAAETPFGEALRHALCCTLTARRGVEEITVEYDEVP